VVIIAALKSVTACDNTTHPRLRDDNVVTSGDDLGLLKGVAMPLLLSWHEYHRKALIPELGIQGTLLNSSALIRHSCDREGGVEFSDASIAVADPCGRTRSIGSVPSLP
jgi:hypothetical protein